LRAHQDDLFRLNVAWADLDAAALPDGDAQLVGFPYNLKPEGSPEGHL
jgi:hypothetical protein